MAQVTRAAHAASVASKLADNAAGDISAQDMREVITDLEDSAMWYDEAPELTTLASTANGEGASLIGVEDDGAHWSTANVEAILDEVGTRFDDLGTMADEETSNYLSIAQAEVTIARTGGDTSFARPTVDSNSVVIWLELSPGDVPVNKGVNDIVPGLQDGVVAINTQSGTAYTLALTDLGKAVNMTNASANTVTIPTNATVAFSVGSVININQLGAGTTTVTGGTGVTVNGTSAGGADVDAQYAGVSLLKTATDTWLMQGAHGTVS